MFKEGLKFKVFFKKFFSLKIFVFFIFFFFNFFPLKNVQASTSILRGAAWWPGQNSYLYFNCLDDVRGDRLDVNYNLCGSIFGSPLLCGTGDYVFHFYSPPCSVSNHRVTIDTNGNFSGIAWNHFKRDVFFEGTTTPPDNYAFNSHCPEECTSTNNCWACYNENDQNVYGWAQSEDGTWINLHPATTTPVFLKSWNPASSSPTYYDLNPGDFLGTATTTASNLSFNCLSENVGGNCSNRNYKVYISNLQIGHLSAPNWSQANACQESALEAKLTWDLKSGSSFPDPEWPGINHQIAFEIIINTSNTTSSPLFDSGTIFSTAQQYVVNKFYFSDFNYSTSYYWWIRLEDENNIWTPWYQFGGTQEHNGLNDTISDSLGFTKTEPDAKTFITYKHEFPAPSFTWSPQEVLISSSTDFISHSQYYNSSNPNEPQDCNDGACQYLWSTTDPGAIISSTTNATNSIIFTRANNTSVSLEVSDIDNYTCSTSTVLSVNYGLPLWREVKP